MEVKTSLEDGLFGINEGKIRRHSGNMLRGNTVREMGVRKLKGMKSSQEHEAWSC